MKTLIFICLIICGGFMLSLDRNVRTEQETERKGEQNNPGEPANDFRYVTVEGEKNRLYTLDAKYTLLFFYNPECEACKQYKEILSASRVIEADTKSGRLKILAIYIDEDLSIWRRHLPEMPKNWIHGRDEDEFLYKNDVYDLHAIPTIYLLDRNKKVILKDVLEVELIEKELMKKNERSLPMVRDDGQ